MIPSPTVSDLESFDQITELAAPVAAAAERLRLAVEAATAERARALGELRQTLLRVGQSVVDIGQRDALARVLYWRHIDLPVRDIEAALGYADHRTLMSAVGSLTSDVACEGCATPLLATSRSRLAELQKLASARPNRYGRRPLCDDCHHRARSEVDDTWADWRPPEDYGYDCDCEPVVWGWD
jgi:hypothetical protein